MTMDETIQSMFPTLAMPRVGSFQPAVKSGTRFIVARDGLWREVTLPWVRVVHKISHTDFSLPYGEVEESISVKCGPIPAHIRSMFLQDAKSAMPNEMAAAVIWNSKDQSWRYELRENTASTVAHVDYREVRLREDEFLVLDLHSHGTFEAFFSSEDDHDDAGSMKFSGVVGNLDTRTITSVLRLNMLGKIWAADLASHGQLEVLCK